MNPLVAAGDDGTLDALLALVRVAGYVGFVMLVGTTFFLTWLWPQGRARRVFWHLLLAGAILCFTASALLPLLDARVGWSSYGGREGASALARMGLTCIVFAFGARLPVFAHTLWVPISLWQVALIGTYVLGSDALEGPWMAVKVVAATAHLGATAVWLGGLLTLAAVLIPGTDLSFVPGVLPRFGVLVRVSVVILVVSGVLHALAIAGGLRQLVDSDYGTVLLIKILVLGVMLLLGSVGRRYAVRLARPPVTDSRGRTPRSSAQAAAVAVGAEFALAVGVLTATAVLVNVAPAV